MESDLGDEKDTSTFTVSLDSLNIIEQERRIL